MAKDNRFRGVRKDNNEWVIGWYVFCRGRHYILEPYNENGYDERWDTGDWNEIDPNSLGQITGFKDKDGKDLWEGDIITMLSYNFQHLDRLKWRVKYDSASMAFVFVHGTMIEHPVTWHSFEKLGNIYENPELVKVT